jgi:putative YphP/YqiW family bacilliredoxin
MSVMYPTELTDPIRAEVRAMGLIEATTPEQVQGELAKPGTTLIFVNSVCGCAAGGARPGLTTALQTAAKKPTRSVTVFAGVDAAATAKARSMFAEYPPSSPSAALLKDGEVVWMLHRHQIEGRHPQQIAELFTQAFSAHC